MSRCVAQPDVQPSAEGAITGVLVIALALSVDSAPAHGLLGLAALGLAVLWFHRSARRVFSLASVPAAFVVIGTALNVVSLRFSPGAGLGVNAAGLEPALSSLGRCLAAVPGLVLVCLAAPARTQLGWLRALRVPALLVHVADSTLRFAEHLRGDARRIERAQVARLGYRGRGALRSAGSLFAALLVRSVARAQRTELALAARGMDGSAVEAAQLPRLELSVIGVPVVVLLGAALLGVGLSSAP
jgi:energy-coupling factor transporter transmembrane protein EcfT